MGANVGGGQSAHALSGAQILARLLALGALGAAFPDNVFAITGSSDATKIARFEVDGLTTGTTRVYTLPDASITVAGINLAQTFSATQTFAGIDATSIGATTRGTGLFTTIGANGAVTLTSTLAVTSLATLTGGFSSAAAGTIDLGTGSNPATALSNAGITLLAADGAFARVTGIAFGSNGLVLSGRGVGGTRASPTATTNGQVLCQFTGFGYDGSTYPTSSSALYSQAAGSLWTASNHETLHEWRVTANGSTTNVQRMVLFGSGNLCLGNAPSDDGVNVLQVTGAMKATGAATLSSTLAVTGVASFGNDLVIGTTGGTSGTLKAYTNAVRNALVARYNDANELGGFYVSSSGQVFFGVNVDISGGNETYSRGSVAAGKWGNPNGTSSYGFEVNVAAAGSAGSTITWTRGFFVTATGGSCVFGPLAALATNATDGFEYMPTCAGTPTGVPTAQTGKVARVYDTTNNKIYVYNGAWKATAALT